jgi:3-methyl-2-oxobutanoate hydroxymethyltransferase
MGGGPAGDAQYLFSDDVLGQNRGRIPRHVKVYADFAAENDRLQALRTDAMRTFATEVHDGAFPSADYVVKAEAEVAAAFRDWLSTNA